MLRSLTLLLCNVSKLQNCLKQGFVFYLTSQSTHGIRLESHSPETGL